jgi:hypothetical protein
MSFLDDIVDSASGLLGGAWDMLTGSGVAGGVARAAALGYMLKEVTASTSKESQQPDAVRSQEPDYGVREQVDPDTNNSIPIVYGEAYLGGKVVDAVLTNGNQTMWYCLTICEQTGPLLSGAASVLSFESVYWNQSEIVFQGDGITAASLRDEEGNSSTDINGLVKFYFYSGSSATPAALRGYAQGTTDSAYNVFPNWTVNHSMENLVFVLIRVDYSKTKNITGLGNLEFKIKNTLTQPGDVLNDYMTNSRYGAGIAAEEINA